MDLEVLEKIVKGRRSIRKWKKEQPPDEVLRKAVELATWAPNGGNFQGWHFTVVRSSEVIDKMANAVQSAIDRIASWPEAEPWAVDMSRSQRNASYFRNAPACIAVFLGQYQSVVDKVLAPRERFDDEAKQMLNSRRFAPTGRQSAAAAVATMLLAFHCMGLGAVWLGAPLVAKKEVESILNGPEDMDLVCLVAVGYPDEAPRKERRPLDQVLTFIP